MDNIQNNTIGVSDIFLCFIFFTAASLGYQILYSNQQSIDIFDAFLKTIGQYNLLNDYDQPLLLEDSKTNDSPQDPPVKENKFEDKYLDQYTALKSASTLFSDDTSLPDDVLAGLSNNFVMEYTPIGNVIMRYDVKRGTFAYYADNVVPFRFLEVLARKYVCTFKCPSLYNSMDDELKRIEELKRLDELKKAEKKEVLKPTVQEQEHDQTQTSTKDTTDKKSVFVKFKDYNKGSSKESASVAVKPAPNNSRKDAASSGPIGAYVKERTNRYSCDGKINNMQFLKKVERKVTDKNYTMTFADFKKSTLSNKA